MCRKAKRVPVTLDPIKVNQLPEEEIKLTLCGADDLIMSGGRSLLAKVLKGSREKNILELNLNNSPVHGGAPQLQNARDHRTHRLANRQ